MKLFFLFILVSLIGNNLYSQKDLNVLQRQHNNKPVIDSTAIVNWPVLKHTIAVSNDGNYVLYNINKPTGANTLVIQSLNNSWKKEFLNINEAIFSYDSKQVIFKHYDTLCFFLLESKLLRKVNNINSYKCPLVGNGEWMAYQFNDQLKTLVLLNLFTNQERRFQSVVDYLFNDSGKVLLLNFEIKKDNKSFNSLQWISLIKVDSNVILNEGGDQSSIFGNYCFDHTGSQLVFLQKRKNGNQIENSIWYYKEGIGKAVMRVNNQSQGIDSGISIYPGTPFFSKNGKWIFFSVQKIENLYLNSQVAKVDIWSYKDVILPSAQTQRLDVMTFVAAINAKGGRVIQLEKYDQKVKAISPTGNSVVIEERSSVTDPWLESYSSKALYIVSLEDSSRKLLNKNGYSLLSFSPNGKFVIFYDNKVKHYFIYNVSSGKSENISQSVSVKLYNEYVKGQTYPVGVAGWYNNDSTLLIYDEFDIWNVDLRNQKQPVNITNYYGRLNNLKLRLVYEYTDKDWTGQFDSLLLTAFNLTNKYNGFYRLYLKQSRKLVKLTMGPYSFYYKDSQFPNFNHFVETLIPTKARDAAIWIVQRMSFDEAPNLFTTKDFKNYTALTNLQPQKAYNWIKAELLTWKQFDGTTTQGILYKPENFDLTKKYPVIFNYYEQLSHKLFEFPNPYFVRNNINIPWFVSQGYLVFTPDIHFSMANLTNKTNGENTFNAVMSAALHLSKKHWVNSRKMGLQGHSFGGFETNYLITHTQIFAAAAEAAGVSNSISSYLSLTGPFGASGGSRQTGTEISQGRLGATLWERKDLYIKNSPVLKADQVTTPLLIMHNKADGAVPWGQGLEMFLALHRLRKKVWMLQYDSGRHSVEGKDAIDFTIRLTQFFDYYLKDASPPRWMTEGILNKFKGIETGYELDTSGNKP